MAAKNIVLCFDGTWNTPGDKSDPANDDSTNVVKFYQSVLLKKTSGKDKGKAQAKWYQKGVGTDGAWHERVAGGRFGLGLDQNIKEGYLKLAEFHSAGDDVYVLGFSRGAYTARSLVGLVRNVGLLTSPTDDLVEAAYDMYRSIDGVDSVRARAFREKHSKEITVKFVGVWDTVGALGVPLTSFQEFNAELYGFHDTKLSSIVENAFHALAIDEHREPFAATLWGPLDGRARALNQRVEQIWFSGSHGDVGGGYKGTNHLSDLALRWMQKRAAECGLGVKIAEPKREDVVAASINDSFEQFLSGAFKFFSRRHFRRMADVAAAAQFLEVTVVDKMRALRDYRPKNEGLSELQTNADAW